MKVNRILAAMLKSEPAEIKKCIYNPSRESHPINNYFIVSTLAHQPYFRSAAIFEQIEGRVLIAWVTSVLLVGSKSGFA